MITDIDINRRMRVLVSQIIRGVFMGDILPSSLGDSLIRAGAPAGEVDVLGYKVWEWLTKEYFFLTSIRSSQWLKEAVNNISPKKQTNVGDYFTLWGAVQAIGSTVIAGKSGVAGSVVTIGYIGDHRWVIGVRWENNKIGNWWAEAQLKTRRTQYTEWLNFIEYQAVISKS